jgi:hypothetical protein
MGLKDENRIHIQKLIYTNLVDRFDTMIDRCFLDNCRDDRFIELVATELKNNPFTEFDFVNLFSVGEGLQDAISVRLENALRQSELRKRHSVKMRKLFELTLPNENCKSPRVNINNGNVLSRFKPINKRIPHSICGYADWLYSRRNSLVHGGGRSTLSDHDIAQIKKLYETTVTKGIKISTSSVKIAAQFYMNVTALLLHLQI